MVGRIVGYVRLRPRMQRGSVRRLGRHTWAAGLGRGLGSVLGSFIPRPGPFTGGHPDRVCAVRGWWRTLVNAGQHCWKACWRESAYGLRSSGGIGGRPYGWPSVLMLLIP